MKKILLFILLFSIISCSSDNVIYQEAHEIANERWHINDYQKFDVEILKDSIYNVQINIRHTTDYEYANLWCFVIVKDSIQQVIRRDTLNLKLAAEDGRWLGEGNSFVNIHQILPKELPLSVGKYSFDIQQGMRTSSLNGIKNVGLTIQPITVK